MAVYRFIAEEKATSGCSWSVAEMCRTLEVSRSGFYDWAGRPPCTRGPLLCGSREVHLVEIDHQAQQVEVKRPEDEIEDSQVPVDWARSTGSAICCDPLLVVPVASWTVPVNVPTATNSPPELVNR
jgi:hypothetical protein